MTDRALDRAAILEAVIPALMASRGSEAVGASDIPEETTALAAVAARSHGILAGVAVAGETFARVGSRLRPVMSDGSPVRPGDVVAEVGGPLRAILAAESTALRFLADLSSLATRAAADEAPEPRSALERHAIAVGRWEPARRALPEPAGGPVAFELVVREEG
ncbi:MAG: hypothetical protein M3245_00075 [Actinomycetota bacterium]|nr:hypothetical protein [Actinomycetota bacterium]